MQRFRYAIFLAVGTGFFVFQAGLTSAHAASHSVSSGIASGAPTAQASNSASSDKPGADAYANHCAICHGEQREGILPAFPPLLGIRRQMTDAQITELVHKGKGRMPAFPKLQNEELTALLRYLGSPGLTAPESAADVHGSAPGAASSSLVEAGNSLFHQNCAFCHGRDTMGGETGPDLTRSKLVLADVGGDKISEVVRNGRPEKKMPAFNFSSQEVASLAAYIHSQATKAASMKGGRRGVDVADLQTGNVEEGKQYFTNGGGCVKCHSVTGDLAGVATRYQGLQLEERMLYPRGAKSRITVTLPSGQKIAGTLAYQDEFVVALRDGDGKYHSWAAGKVKYQVDSPANAHVDLFSKYTDADIHNLMAYLQTLR
jgi:mono/diheme cytochrome c family protein